MASEKRQMVAAPVVVEDLGEMIVWDGPKKRTSDGQPFTKEKHSCPRVKTNPKIDIPLTLTGHLPNLGTITEEEEERLQALYGRIDPETYLLQKNRYAVRNKFYIKVSDAQTLAPRAWVNDSIVNFVWLQLAETFNGDVGKEGTSIAFFPCFFVTKLMGEGGDDLYDYQHVSRWSETVLGQTKSPLDFDVLLFPKCSSGHWWVYVMYPKARHIECMDSLFYNKNFKIDIQSLWWWLNDDLHCHWGLETPLDQKEWTFTSQRATKHGGLPTQTNGWDCGLYAVHVGFALATQAPFSEITKERIHLYRRKLVLYLLDGDDTRDIMLPDYSWNERVQLQSGYFPRESERLYHQGVPKCVVDVCGDGNCLYYCLLNYLVQSGYLNDTWVNPSHPVVWMRKTIRKQARLLKSDEWLKISVQDSPEFIESELDRMYNSSIDYMDGEVMRESDAYHGHSTDCLAFAQKYEMVVVLYQCDSNQEYASTLILDGRQSSSESVTWLKGINPAHVAPGPAVLELVRYKTDTDILSLQHKSGKPRLVPKMIYGVEQGPGHFVFVDRSTPKVLLPPAMIQEAVLTRAQESRMLDAYSKDSGQSSKDNNASGGAPPPNDAPTQEGNAGGDGPPPGNSDDDSKKSETNSPPASPKKPKKKN